MFQDRQRETWTTCLDSWGEEIKSWSKSRSRIWNTKWVLLLQWFWESEQNNWHRQQQPSWQFSLLWAHLLFRCEQQHFTAKVSSRGDANITLPKITISWTVTCIMKQNLSLFLEIFKCILPVNWGLIISCEVLWQRFHSECALQFLIQH